MLLAEPQGVLGARFAVGRRLARHPLDLIQRLEELERLQWRTARRLPGLERVGKFPARMRHTAEMRRACQRAPGVIAVAHQQAAIAVQEGLRILLAATGLVIEQHDRLRAVLAAAVGPHEGFGLRVPALLFQNLDPSFVTVDQGLRPAETALPADVEGFLRQDVHHTWVPSVRTGAWRSADDPA